MGTRSPHIESFMKREKPHKHLCFVLNKCDLVPTWVVVLCGLWCRLTSKARWIMVLSKDYPTLAFHASVTNSFGKGSLINLLRQYGKVLLLFNIFL
jgi:nuclear GTP-binding protein